MCLANIQILSGLFHIVVHYFLSFAQRVAMGNKMFGSERKPDDLEQVMKELYFDLAGKVLPYQLPNITQCVDMDKIVYGSDAPYTTDQVVTMLADELESTELISRHELEKCYMITANNY